MSGWGCVRAALLTAVLLAVSLEAVAPVPAAQAARPATLAEALAITNAYGIPGECFDIRVSSANPAWATIEDRGGVGETLDHNSCPRFGALQLTAFRDGQWEDVGERVSTRPCDAAVVPIAIGKELGYCFIRSTYLLCQPSRPLDDFARRPVSEPSRCNTLGPGQSLAEVANWARLRWKGWGRPTATARGVELGTHRPHVRVPVRLYAYRRREDCDGDYVYTRVRVTTRYGRGVLRFPADCSG